MGQSTYLLAVDSGQRDVALYPNTNDYVITINRPLYNITSIKLATGRIPLSQYTIDSYNSTFKYDNTTINLIHRDYLTGNALASNVQEQIVDITGEAAFGVEYFSNTSNLVFTNTSAFTLTFGDSSPAAAFGFLPGTTPSAFTHSSTSIDIDGPQSLLMSLNGDGRDDIKTELYFTDDAERPVHFFGRIATTAYTARRFIDHNGKDDPVGYNFPRGSEDYMNTIRVRFFCNNFNQIFPYDFKQRNHMLKFEVTCDMDKFNTLKKDIGMPRDTLPPVIELPRFKEGIRLMGSKKLLLYGGAVVVLVIILLLVMPKKI